MYIYKNRAAPTGGVYACPAYKTTTRAGTLSTTGMYIYMCIYSYMCVYICVYIYIYVFVCMYVYI